MGTVAGVVGAFVGQWVRSRFESPKVIAEARKLEAEAEQSAAAAWHQLYDEVCKRLAVLEEKCEGLRALASDVEKLKLENNRLRKRESMGERGRRF